MSISNPETGRRFLKGEEKDHDLLSAIDGEFTPAQILNNSKLNLCIKISYANCSTDAVDGKS
jgi:hypothetical protein